MFLINGDLTLADGGTTYVPDKRVAGKGSGTFGSLDIAGEKEKVMPSRVSPTWFSYLDDRFYKGEFALPVDRMEQLFARGAPAPPPRKRQAYDLIIFGMAPSGNVSIWAAAGQVATEAATSRAQPIELPWSEILVTSSPSRAEHIQDMLGEALTPLQIADLKTPARLAAWNDYPRRLS